MAKSKEKDRPVVVTTDRRGVFFGYLLGEPSKERITLKNARNCLLWPAEVKGFVGLASSGPNKGCRVGPSAPEMTLYDITAVIECSEEAAAAWEGQPWKS